jgi:hypothetical protein
MNAGKAGHVRWRAMGVRRKPGGMPVLSDRLIAQA